MNDSIGDAGERPVLEAQGLVVHYGRKRVLDAASLELRPGETVFLLGANGAGKSTLMRALVGAAPVRAGSVRLGELDARRRVDAARRRIGFVPDQLDLPGWMTGREALAFVGGHQPRWDGERALGLLAEFGVDARCRVGELSRGQGVLVMLAAALGHAPDVLLLDEPFANLDPGARLRVQRCLLEHVGGESGDTNTGGAVARLVSTHDLDVAVRLADRVLVLEGGRLRELATDDGAPLAARRERLMTAFGRVA